MPRLIIPEGRTETLVDAINYLLSRDGVANLSLRSIARESRVSTSSMLHHFGSREQLLRVAAQCTGRARLRVIEERARREGPAAFLPLDGDEEDLITARAWLGWGELWRHVPAVAAVISRIRDQEHVLLAGILGVSLGHAAIPPLVALLDGLQVAMCAPDHPMQPAGAREILRRQMEADPALGNGPVRSLP